MEDSGRRSKRGRYDSGWVEYQEGLNAREESMVKLPDTSLTELNRTLDPSSAWLETQAQVTGCHYEFARMNVLMLGIASDTNRFRISYTYYAHATTFRDEFTSPVAMEQGKTFPVSYNPLNPQENRQSVPRTASTSRNPLFALAIAGSIVISLLYLAMMHGCN
jgi:hypothetical protein